MPISKLATMEYSNLPYLLPLFLSQLFPVKKVIPEDIRLRLNGGKARVMVCRDYFRTLVG